MARIIFHLDMDAFFAAIEQRDNPSLRGKPVIVGSPPTQRGVVAAASYEARKFGVRSAMPSVTAGRLCPKGVFVRPRMDVYRAESARIMSILEGTGAVVEQTSIDEAYLEIPLERLHATCGTACLSSKESATVIDDLLLAAVPIARGLKERIWKERGLTASVGIAGNKFLAKLASDFQKPNGLTLVPERDKVLFLRPMPIRAIHGVGTVTEQVLQQAGVRTIADLQDYPGDLRSLVGSWGPKLKGYAFGEDDRPLSVDDEVKSISSEETFLHDTEDRKLLRGCLRVQANEISERLKRKRLGAHTVQVKIRYSDFTTLTRQVTMEEIVTEPKDIYRLGCFLLAREKLVHRPLRLLGLGVSNLTEASARQLLLL